jgi:signal transduction histidine kinase
MSVVPAVDRSSSVRSIDVNRRPSLPGAYWRALADPSAWRRIAYLLLAFPLGTAYFIFLVTGLSTGLGMLVTLVGLPILAGMLVAWRALARFERRLAGPLLGVELPDPYRPVAEDASWWQRLRARVADAATWKDLAYLLVDFPLGIAGLTVVATLLGAAGALLAAPAYYWVGGIDMGLFRADTLPEALALTVLGAVVLPLAVQGSGAFALLHRLVARLLLTASGDPELSARVVDLQSSRARILAAADAERRRLERDLHDGAQQRLVAISLNLGMARTRLQKGDDALDLVTAASEDARMAVQELRDLARGIHPAVLSERGLAPALRDLATRAPIPVDVTTDFEEERFPSAVEVTAYFVASEALTNVAKYAGAERASVRAERRDGVLVVEVGDDGVGGAAAGAGSGLRGLADRVGALDGAFEVDSAPGAGTRIVARLPVRVSGDAAERRTPPRPCPGARPRASSASARRRSCGCAAAGAC